jgi:ribonuclease HI
MSFSNASNNEAEYEALLHGMSMAKACGATHLKIFRDSNLVVQQVMSLCDALSDNMIAYRDMYYNLQGTFLMDAKYRTSVRQATRRLTISQTSDPNSYPYT